jgi:hypothetical protein
MTVKELIENLSKIEDQNIKVMVKGYEGGYNDIIIGNNIDNNTPAIYDIALDVNDKWYYGRHERIEDVIINARGEYNTVKAIIL